MKMPEGNALAVRLRLVAASSAAGQILPLLAMPWLTRLFSPDAFGVFAVFFATVMTISIVASGRYEMRVPVADDDDEAARVFVGSLAVLAVFTGVSTVVGVSAWMLAGVTYSSWPLWLGAAYVLCAGTLQSLTSWLTRRERFGLLSATRLIQSLVTAASSIALGHLTSAPWGLALGAALGQASGALVALIGAWTSLASAWRKRGIAPVASTLRQHLDYPRVNAPHALLDGIRESGFQGIFALMFGPAVNGLYSLSVRVLRVPASFVAGSIGQVLFGQLARDARERLDSRALLWRAVGTVGAVSVIPFAVVLFLGPTLFATVFGEPWREAGRYAQVMAPSLWLGLAISPVATLPLVTGRLRTAFLAAVADLGIRGLALGVGAATGSAMWALAILTTGSSIACLLLLRWYNRLATRSTQQRIVFLGQTRWSHLLVDQLSQHPIAGKACSFAAVGLDRPWSILDASSIFSVLSANVVVRVGLRPAGDTPFAKVFSIAWRTLRFLRPSQRVIMYWIGTDVAQSRRMLQSGRNRTRFSRAVRDEGHIAASPGLVEELRALGVESRLVWFPGLTLKVPETVPAMPTRFTVLSYVPDTRFDFYGGPKLLDLARAFPDLDLRIAGGTGSWADDPPPNAVFLGWVRNMAEEYSRCSVVIRLVEHDALGATAIEGLLYGRHVVYSGVLQDSRRVPFDDAAALQTAIAELLRRHQERALEPRQEAADRARSVFDQQNRLMALWQHLDGLR
jgi:O-antigen/teichoic acid export membrane protein